MEAYRSQGGNAASRQQGVDIGAGGQAIGSALEGLGQAIDRKNLLQAQSKAAKAFADFQIADDHARRQAREASDAFGTGHAATVTKDFDERSTAFLGTIRDARVRGQYEAQIANHKADIVSAEEAWELGKQNDGVTNTAGEVIDLHANRVRHGDAAAHVSSSLAADTYVNGLPVTESVKVALRRTARAKIDTSWARNQIDSDPVAALKAFQAGDYDASVPPNVLESLINDAQVGVHNLQSAGRAAKAAAVSDEREAIATYKVGLSASGKDTPSRIEAMAVRAEAIGDTSTALDLRNTKAEVMATATYHAAPLPVINQRIQALTLKETHAGHLSPAEASERGGLIKMADALKSGIKDDPLITYQGQTGQVAPTYNPDDPASVAKVVAYGKRVQQHYGLPNVPVLTGDQVESMKLNMNTPGGKRKVLATISALGDYASEAARQIAPDDDGFAQLNDLSAMPFKAAGAAAVHDIMAGEDALKAAPAIFAGPIMAEAHKAFGAASEGAMTSPAMARATFDNARKLYAAASFNDHDVAPLHLNKARWAQAVDRALGAFRDTATGKQAGGLTMMNGGAVVVPPGMLHNTFHKRLTRASIGQWQHAKLTGDPVWSGGEQVTLGELRGAVPAFKAPDIYGLKVGNTTIYGRDGQPFLFSLKKLGMFDAAKLKAK